VSVPTKGLSLPLVSAGGSGLVITCAALGLLFSVTRHEHPQEVPRAFDREPEMQPISTSSLLVESIWRDLAVK
jgi:cell division protein FtsW